MGKWDILKDWLERNAYKAQASYVGTNEVKNSVAKSMYLQQYTDLRDILDRMGELEREEKEKEQESREQERQDPRRISKSAFDQKFLKFLRRGISSKEWDSALNRIIKKYPDEANFWEGYTAALINIKTYYERLLRMEEENGQDN